MDGTLIQPARGGVLVLLHKLVDASSGVATATLPDLMVVAPGLLQNASTLQANGPGHCILEL